MDEVIINVLVREIQSSERQELGSRNAGLALKYTLIGGINTNKILKERYTSLRSFIDRYSQFFHSTSHEDSPTEFKINLVKNAPLNKLPPLPSNVRLSRLSSSDQMTDGDSDLSEEEDSDESHSTKSIDGLDSDDDTALRASKTGADYDDDDVDRVLSDLNHSDDDESSTRTSLSADEPMLEMLPPFVSKSREDLTNLLKADLQQLLKDNSLKVTGGKPELVDRYLEWQETERLKWEAEKTRIEELQIARLEEADLRRMRQADETRFRDNTSESPFIPRSWSSGTRSPNRNTGVGGVGAGIRTPLGGSRFAPQQLQGRVQATSGRAQFQPYQSVGHGSSLSNGFNNYRGSGTTDLNVSRPPPPTYTTFITPAGSYTATSGSASSTGGAMLDSSVTAGIEPQTVAVMNVVKRFMDKQGLEVVRLYSYILFTYLFIMILSLID